MTTVSLREMRRFFSHRPSLVRGLPSLRLAGDCARRVGRGASDGFVEVPPETGGETGNLGVPEGPGAVIEPTAPGR